MFLLVASYFSVTILVIIFGDLKSPIAHLPRSHSLSSLASERLVIFSSTRLEPFIVLDVPVVMDRRTISQISVASIPCSHSSLLSFRITQNNPNNPIHINSSFPSVIATSLLIFTPLRIPLTPLPLFHLFHLHDNPIPTLHLLTP